MTAAEDPALAGDALLRPVRLGNAFEDTVGRLLQTIRLGVLEPGESLPPERELAARLGVSRDTVREAIKSLAEAGYLVSKRGRYGGTFLATDLPVPPPDVPRFTRDEIDDALRLREILEVGAARMAATRTLTAAEREGLWSRIAVAGAVGCREPDAPQRPARPDPAAVTQHRAFRRAARGPRDRDPGRGCRCRRMRDARSRRRVGGAAARFPGLTGD